MCNILRLGKKFKSTYKSTANPGELRGTQITLTELPTSSDGLETGILFNDNGTVKIVT